MLIAVKKTMVNRDDPDEFGCREYEGLDACIEALVKETGCEEYTVYKADPRILQIDEKIITGVKWLVEFYVFCEEEF